MSYRETFFVTFPGVRALALHGELDAGTSRVLESAASMWIGTKGSLTIELDDLSFIDSTGVRSLMALAEGLLDGNLQLHNPQRNVGKVFEILDIEAISNIKVVEQVDRPA